MTDLLLSDSGGPRRWDLLALGDPCADLVVAAEEPPRSGEKVLGRSLGVFAGGAETNVACAASRLGRRSAVYGRVGADAHGILLRESLQRFGVDTEFLTVEPEIACVSVIVIVTRAGERAIIYVPMPPRLHQLDVLTSAVRQSRIAYLMPYSVDELTLVSRVARENDVLVAIDIEAAVAPNPAEMSKRIALADIVFFNESGFAAGTGEVPTQASMTRLLSAGPRIVVVTRGAAGAAAVDDSGFAEHQAFDGPVVDTTGAGDTFNAAFLAATLEGQNRPSAVRFGCAAASCTVAAVGARGNLPDRQTVTTIITCADEPR